MGIKTYNPYTPSRRNMTGSDFSEITKTTPEKSLCVSLKKNSGRNNQGKITGRLQEIQGWHSGNCSWYRIRPQQNSKYRTDLLRRWPEGIYHRS